MAIVLVCSWKLKSLSERSKCESQTCQSESGNKDWEQQQDVSSSQRFVCCSKDTVITLRQLLTMEAVMTAV